MNREAHPERSPLQSMPIPQVCVIGAGYWGQNLIRNFHQLGALAMVCDARPEVLARLQEAYPQLTLVQTLEEALEQAPALGIVSMVVATPSVTHYAVGSAVLNAGFHVYIEKPLATSLVDAQALVSLAEKKHLKLMVGHLLMYHPAVIRIKELIDQGRLGTLRYLQSDRLNFNVPRADRNALWDLAVHDLAMLDCLLPEWRGQWLARQRCQSGYGAGHLALWASRRQRPHGDVAV
jgi:UDP-2-acetamido-3-amino-2,3-dideoxy-glucuronate N-acetyltransferase